MIKAVFIKTDYRLIWIKDQIKNSDNITSEREKSTDS